MSSHRHHLRRWITLTDGYDFQRYHFACAVIGKRIVVAGGIESWTEIPETDEFGNYEGASDQSLNSVAVLDLATKKSIPHTIPALPFSGECDGALLNDHFYVFSYRTGAAYRLYLGLDSRWEKLPIELPELDKVVCADRHLYLVNRREGITVHRYDPVTNKLTNIPGVPTGNSFHASTVAVVRNHIYFISSTLDIFNTASQTWSAAPPPPIQIKGSTAVAFERWIIVTCHAKIKKQFHSQTLVYDTAIQQWILNNSIPPQESFCHRLIMFKSFLISVGGHSFLDFLRGWDTNYFNVRNIFSDFRWNRMKHCILIRQLVDKGRAFPMLANQPFNNNSDEKKTEEVIQKLCSDVISDVFRNVISYLI